MSTFAEALSQALFSFLWQGAVVALLLYIILTALRPCSANARYLSACMAMLVMAALPVINIWVFYRRGLAPHAVAVDTAATAMEETGTFFAASIGESMAVFNPVELAMDDYQTLFLRLWALGVVLFFMRLLLACDHAGRMRRQARPAEQGVIAMAQRVAWRMGVRNKFRVLVSANSNNPGVIGWIKPAIVIPAAVLTGLTRDQLEAVLAHEIAHIRRYDYLVNFLQSMVEVVLFYHPAVWWISRQIRRERELCCDDMAVNCLDNVLGYARALTEVEKLRLSELQFVPGVAGHPLLYRIRRLLGQENSASGLIVPALVFTLILVLPAGVSILAAFDSIAGEQTTQLLPEETQPLSMYNLLAQIDAGQEEEPVADRSSSSTMTDGQIRRQLTGEWYGELEKPSAVRPEVYRFEPDEDGELVAYIVNNPDNPHTLATKIYRFEVKDGSVVMEQLNYEAQEEGRFFGFRGKFTGDAIVGEYSNKGGSYPLVLKKGKYVIPVYHLNLSRAAMDQLRGEWESEPVSRFVTPPDRDEEVEVKSTMRLEFEVTESEDYLGYVEFTVEVFDTNHELIGTRRNRHKITEASLDDGELVLNLKSPRSSFEGKILLNEIVGRWTMGVRNSSAPTSLKRIRDG